MWRKCYVLKCNDGTYVAGRGFKAFTTGLNSCRLFSNIGHAKTSMTHLPASILDKFPQIIECRLKVEEQ